MAGERALPRFQARRQLGRTGFQATRVGIGDLADRSVPLVRCVATLHRAMDAGLNVIDTAPGYEDGYSEQIVGEALRGRREGMFVIDKVDFLEQPVTPQVEESLRRLGLEAVDLFVFHSLSQPGGADAGAPSPPHLGVEECVRYTLTLEPDVALLGMSFPNEQDAALHAAAAFQPLTAEQMADVRQRAVQAIEGKGAVWWNP